MTIYLPVRVQKIVKMLQLGGYEAYIVGGCVRDAIMKRQPNDWDICTNASPSEVMTIFAKEKVIETGLQHGTVTVMIDGYSYEVTTYRKDGSYTDGRRPDSVEFVSNLKDDLSRRDFTINAMAYNEERGLVDYFGGIDDIQKKIIKTVGDPFDRFSEDGLRILRAIRFSSVLEFQIEDETSHAMRMCSNMLAKVSQERIMSEFNKMLLGINVEEVLLNYPHIIAEFIPEIIPSIGFCQNNPYHYLQVWEHTAKAVGKIDQELHLRLAMFLHDIGKPAAHCIGEDGVSHYYGHNIHSVNLATTIMKRMKYDNKTTEKVLLLVDKHDNTIGESRKMVRRLLNEIGSDCFDDLIKVQTADALSQVKSDKKMHHISLCAAMKESIMQDGTHFTLKNLAVNGNDLIKFGIKPGKEIGTILNTLLQLVIGEEIENDRLKLLYVVEELIKVGGSEA